MAAGDYVSRDYVDARLRAIAEQAHTELAGHILVDDNRFDSQQRALDQAATNVERRLEEMNQFRDENRRFATTMIPRELYDREHHALVARVDTLEDDRQRQEGAMSTLRFIILLLSIPGLIGALVAVLSVAQGKVP